MVTDILRIIDKIDKIGVDNVKSELKYLDINDNNIEEIIKFISIDGNNNEKIAKLKDLNIENETFNKGINELETVVNNLKDLQINEDNYCIDLTIARGLDYYTGTVYETILKDFPNIGSVCSGGRYDNLATYYTDKVLPGVGISIGLTRLFYQLKESKILKDEENNVSDVTILPLCDDFSYIYQYFNVLKDNGVKVDIVYLNKFKQMIKYADRQNTPYALIIGEDEVNKNIAIFKDMKTGTQEEVTVNNIVKKLKLTNTRDNQE